jgi:hypothetical protein
MRIKRSIGVMLALAGAFIGTSAPLKKFERQRLVAHLEMTQSWLQDEVAGLSSTQLHFRPTPSAWNIQHERSTSRGATRPAYPAAPRSSLALTASALTVLSSQCQPT